MVSRLYITVVLLLFMGCAGSSTKPTTDAVKLEFRLPDVPSMIGDPKSRQAYMTTHYWDNFNFSDTLLLASDSIRGLAIAGYVQLLEMGDSATIAQAVERVSARSLSAGSEAFDWLYSTLDRYLFDPNSPLRNEELYIPFLQDMLSRAGVEDHHKVRAEYQLALALKNRKGALATDFNYMTMDGIGGSLYGLESKYTVIFFNTPDCPDCARVKKFISGSRVLKRMCEESLLEILAIYPEDDLDLWRAAEYPTFIVNGYDRGMVISESNLYDLKAIPSLYLLDKDKRIILKDRSIEEVDHYLKTVQ